MRKKISEEYLTKAKKREIKKRPRMQIHSRSLILGSKHAGKKLTAKS
jgi:hypothetical protein